MPSPKPIPFTDVSFLERLTKQNIFQILLNLALYLSFVLPLANQIQFPVINSPWKDVSNEVALIFLLSGFGFVYWASGRYIRFWLMSLRTELEFGIKILGAKILGAWLGVDSNGEKSPVERYVEDKNLVSKFDVISYLSKSENKFLEKLYKKRLETNIKYNLNKENTVTTFTLLSLHWYFKSKVYLSISQYFPVFLQVAILLLLLWSSAEPFPEDNDYFYIPGNPIRNSVD